MWQDTRSILKKSVSLLHTNDKRVRKKSDKHHHLKQPQITKYLGVTLTKEVKDLYNKNFKSLKKEIEENIKIW